MHQKNATPYRTSPDPFGATLPKGEGISTCFSLSYHTFGPLTRKNPRFCDKILNKFIIFMKTNGDFRDILYELIYAILPEHPAYISERGIIL